MNKIVIVVLLLVAVVGAYFAMNKDVGVSETSTSGSQAVEKQKENVIYAGDKNTVKETKSMEPKAEDAGYDDTLDESYDEEIVAATKLYSNADDAFAKIKASAADYDDIVLEQFAELPDSCSWCPDLYRKVTDAMLSATDENERSYMAELLSITGKEVNLETIIDAYADSSSEDDKEIYLESLELTAGDDKLVDYLSGKMGSGDSALDEALVAAITNHGSVKAIEKLYDETVKSGDPDKFYDMGIGIGEVIPDQEALPYLRDMANKKDEYSPLAIKALLNYGDEGLREVVDIISASGDSELNQRLLKDALDHVSFDEDTEKYVKDLVAISSNPDVKKFAEEILADMDYELSDTDS